MVSKKRKRVSVKMKRQKEDGRRNQAVEGGRQNGLFESGTKGSTCLPSSLNTQVHSAPRLHGSIFYTTCIWSPDQKVVGIRRLIFISGDKDTLR
jgi:hypothetical protein